ncbi:hypothetical protein IDH44_12560 [Paenibacillus sp. IB182496]|uniref:Signal transduction histidine kinase n=1 Tax=Paenibacillus sabuli TaxID=2772509 RepID=A0A927GRV0_9BACL|nr:hypothetical protein [Paenibacillus sabuli]MBD2846029.1 hypothetical protein [Paenibacillus sabuli]
MDTTSTLIFIIAAFSLGAVILMRREQIPQTMRRGMALVAIVLIAFAFFALVFSFLNLGKT